jgi:hypothetical protein
VKSPTHPEPEISIDSTWLGPSTGELDCLVGNTLSKEKDNLKLKKVRQPPQNDFYNSYKIIVM